MIFLNPIFRSMQESEQARLGGQGMPVKRIAAERAEELLGMLMDVIAEEGFASLKVSDLAQRLRCSTSTLYRIAPSKESLVLLAFRQWADDSLREILAEAERCPTPSDRARSYYLTTIGRVGALSEKFRADVSAYESTRHLYGDMAEQYAIQLAHYVNEAIRAGEIRQFNAAFLA